MQNTIKTFTTPYGELTIDTVADAKMAAVFARGEYHQHDTIELISAFVTPQSIFVDGGAHVGTITIPIANKAARAVAYEADAATCDILRHNVERNHISTDVRQKGLGEEAGRGEMRSVHADNAGSHTLEVGDGCVEIVTLDAELERFDVLKLDVEGMELSVLHGARRIIEEVHPVMLFEVNLSQLRAHSTTLSALGSFLTRRNYRLYLPFHLHGELVLGSVPSISLVALLMYPGAYLLHRTSSVFDILALPEGKPVILPVVSAWRTVAYILGENLRDKMRRIQKFFA
ncbi:MAG: FkbM family methyltransferase [Candidatus Paceibacterota bacterium]